MPLQYLVDGNKSGMGVQFKTLIRSDSSGSVVGYLRGLSMGGVTDMYGRGTSGVRNLQTGLQKSTTEGSPGTPSLQLTYPNGMWRFRWTVKVGNRSVSIKTKQFDNGMASQRPTLIVKANSLVGLNADLTATAPAGSDWVTIGPISFTATTLGVVWVEVWNNLNLSNKPAYFDHIVVS